MPGTARAALALALFFAAGAAAEEPKSPQEATEEALDTVKIVLEVESEPLQDVAAIFAERSRLTYIVDPQTGAAETPVAAATSGMTLRAAADLFLKDLGLCQANWNGIVVWTTAERAAGLKSRAGLALPANATAEEQAVWHKLETARIALNFTECAAEDIVGFLRDFNGLQIEVEAGAETKVTLNMNNASLVQVLDVLAFLLDGTAEFRQGRIVIAEK